MLVLCPSCETEYEIPPLQRPRKLRCARCASEWRVMPEGEPAPATVAVLSLDGPGVETPGIDGAKLDGAKLDGAKLDGARLDGAGPDGAGPDGSILERDLAAGAQPEPGTDAVPGAVPGALSAEQPLSPPATAQRNPAGRLRLGRDALAISSLWLLSVVLVIAGLWALWHWRVPISHHWPPSLRLYQLLPNGVPAPRVGRPHPAA